ncbi:AraC family transcriptional regulator [Mycobacteroides immunogenum]|uniref:AraC family transcriptional regulator n=1 Tax=Mycobacteroides immunogenum TaxID=83262 RepID=UPI0025B7782D|nr:AraC family transcriptional regulator [Mycobacteroides immunogenum]WJR36124.1 AraC family transcriptional regulator [Mycobacteroides immunogenum]
MTANLTHPKLPLAAYPRLVTTDFEEAVSVVGQTFMPFDLSTPGGGGTARFHSVELGSIGLYYLDYGATVQISAREHEDFYLVQIPLSGAATTVCGHERVDNDAATGVILSPGCRPSLWWRGGTPHLLMRIDHSALMAQLHEVLGCSTRAPLRFDLAMDLRAPSMSAFKSVLDMLVHEVDALNGQADQVVALEQVRALLLSRLLLAQPNTHSEALNSPTARVASHVVQRAVDIIEAGAGAPLTVEEIAAQCCVGLRSLQMAFREHLDTTPSHYLRQVRLRKAATELAKSNPDEKSVAEIASRWGFTHQGRFAGYYKEQFGEAPSATLRFNQRP